MLEPGAQATVEEVVSDAMTARRLGSGDVPVLGTPAVVALAERAAIAAISGELTAAQTTVGASVDLRHSAPTPAGATVAASATLIEVDGRTLRFAFEVRDGAGGVADGTHTRVIVDRTTFIERATRRGAERRA